MAKADARRARCSRRTARRSSTTRCSSGPRPGSLLVGTEVKSIRDGGFSFSDSWVDLRGGRARAGGLPDRALQPRQPDEPRPRARRASCCCTGVRSRSSAARATERGLTLVPLRALPEERPREDGDRPRARQAGPRQARLDPQEGRGARHAARAAQPPRRLGPSRAQYSSSPPSTPTTAPLTNDASRRPGTRRRSRPRPASRAGRPGCGRASTTARPRARVRAVSESIRPGATQFAVMPSGPSSRAQVRVMPTMPAFAAE